MTTKSLVNDIINKDPNSQAVKDLNYIDEFMNNRDQIIYHRSSHQVRIQNPNKPTRAPVQNKNQLGKSQNTQGTIANHTQFDKTNQMRNAIVTDLKNDITQSNMDRYSNQFRATCGCPDCALGPHNDKFKVLADYYTKVQKDEDAVKNTDRFKILQMNIQQSIYSMKLAKFLELDTSRRIAHFENFQKQVKNQQHENTKLTDFPEFNMAHIVEEIVKDAKNEDGMCCLNAHIANSLSKLAKVDAGKYTFDVEQLDKFDPMSKIYNSDSNAYNFRDKTKKDQTVTHVNPDLSIAGYHGSCKPIAINKKLKEFSRTEPKKSKMMNNSMEVLRNTNMNHRSVDILEESKENLRQMKQESKIFSKKFSKQFTQDSLQKQVSTDLPLDSRANLLKRNDSFILPNSNISKGALSPYTSQAHLVKNGSFELDRSLGINKSVSFAQQQSSPSFASPSFNATNRDKDPYLPSVKESKSYRATFRNTPAKLELSSDIKEIEFKIKLDNINSMIENELMNDGTSPGHTDDYKMEEDLPQQQRVGVAEVVKKDKGTFDYIEQSRNNMEDKFKNPSQGASKLFQVLKNADNLLDIPSLRDQFDLNNLNSDNKLEGGSYDKNSVNNKALHAFKRLEKTKKNQNDNYTFFIDRLVSLLPKIQSKHVAKKGTQYFLNDQIHKKVKMHVKESKKETEVDIGKQSLSSMIPLYEKSANNRNKIKNSILRQQKSKSKIRDQLVTILKYLNDDKMNHQFLRLIGMNEMGDSGENEDLLQKYHSLVGKVDRQRVTHLLRMRDQIEKYERVIENVDKTSITPVSFFLTDILRASIMNNREVDIHLIKYALDDLKHEHYTLSFQKLIKEITDIFQINFLSVQQFLKQKDIQLSNDIFDTQHIQSIIVPNIQKLFVNRSELGNFE